MAFLIFPVRPIISRKILTAKKWKNYSYTEYLQNPVDIWTLIVVVMGAYFRYCDSGDRGNLLYLM